MDKDTAVKLLKRVIKVEIPPQRVVIVTAEEAKEIADFIEQQETYAELGRLSLTTRAMVCSNNDFIKRGTKQCEKHCTNYQFCQKRAELLGELSGMIDKEIGKFATNNIESEESKYPDKCPITNSPLFMEIEHPLLGFVPTYGGTYDSYTIPEIDEEGDFYSYRFDHDEGCWVDGVEVVGNATEILIDLRAKLEAVEIYSQNASKTITELDKQVDELKAYNVLLVEALKETKPYLDMAAQYRKLINMGVIWDDPVAAKVRNKIDQTIKQAGLLAGGSNDYN